MSQTTSNFVSADFQWLCQRFPFDAKSRAPTLLKDFVAQLDKQQPQYLVDLGAGFGANFLFLAPQISAPQRWTLLDRDAALTQKVNWLVENAALFLGKEAATQFQKRLATGNIVYESKTFDFDQISTLKLPKVNAFVANAVFDLNSQAQYDRLLDDCLRFRPKDGPLLLYWTLHLSPSLSLEPLEGGHEYFLELFHQHMRRPQSFGQASGADSARMIADAFAQRQIPFLSAPSDWQIVPQEKDFLHANFSFLISATNELCPPHKRKEWNAWVEKSKQQIDNAELSLRIGHRDHLAIIQ